MHSMIMVLNKVQEEKQQGLVATQQQQQATSAATTGGIGDGGGGERLPLLGITNRGAVAAATTAPSNTNISNVPIQKGVGGGGGGGGSIKKTAVNGSSNLASSSSLSKQKARTRQSLRSFRRKGRETTTEFESWRGRIGVHVECDEFKLKELELVLADQLPGWDFVNHYDVLRLWQRPLLPVLIKENSPSVSSFQNQPQTLPVLLLPETREAFIFSFGAVVLFNFPTEQSELEWMQAHLFSSSCDSPAGTSVYGTRHDPRAIESACDDFEFEYGEVFSLKHDICCFMTREPGEKLAVAFALAKSSLLSIYEWTLEQTITRNSHITEHLAKTGNIPMHKEELSIEIGRLFLVKHMVNLDSNLQDTPEEFWEDDKFSFQYEKSMAYLDIPKRFNLINSRLNMLQDLHEVLNEAVRAKHDVAMEWIIIWLIVVYLVIEFYLAGVE